MVDFKIFLWKIFRWYTHTPLPQRHRLFGMFYRYLWSQNKYILLRASIKGVPFEFDLSDSLQVGMFYGFYEPDEIVFLSKILKRGDIFVDAGANVGYYSAVAAAKVGIAGIVHAFEPVNWLYNRLQSWGITMKGKGYHILTQPAALSNHNGKTKIFISKENIGRHTIILGLRPKEEIKEEYEVATQRLDDYFCDSGYQMPSVVKIDVEGAERKVLEGMEGIFARGERPILMIELGEFNWGYVYSYLSRLGYQPFCCIGGGRLKRITHFAQIRGHLVIWLPTDRKVVYCSIN